MKTETLNKLTAFMGVLAIATGGLFAATLVSAQESYLYVDNTGSISAEAAETPTEAITDAEDIMDNSGVIEAEAYYALGGEAAGESSDSMSDDDTYLYVAADGTIDAEAADTPTEAINEADDIQYNSGVIDAEMYYALSSEAAVTSTTPDSGENMYAYVATDGDIQYEAAENWEAAISEAEDIQYNSGVMILSE